LVDEGRGELGGGGGWVVSEGEPREKDGGKKDAMGVDVTTAGGVPVPEVLGEGHLG
jgi:hypothetical protein